MFLLLKTKGDWFILETKPKDKYIVRFIRHYNDKWVSWDEDLNPNKNPFPILNIAISPYEKLYTLSALKKSMNCYDNVSLNEISKEDVFTEVL